MPDSSREIAARIENARRETRPLAIVGGNSKPFVGRAIEADALEVAGHSGIVSYSPNELVLTARGGTTIAEIEQTLGGHGQIMGFEPPRFAETATIGGTLACNLSGPRRPWAGSIRDAVLGVRLITGRAEQLRFGGQVMKNVAGFDVSRLQSGALGAFGVIGEVSLRLLPKPAAQMTLVQELDAVDALARMSTAAGEPKPLSGAAWLGGRLYLRLEGAASAVAAAAKQWGGERLDDRGFWSALNEHRLPFFQHSRPLWRFSVKPTAPLHDLGADWLIDWGGAQRFVAGELDRSELESIAAASGGHVCLCRGGDRTGEVRQTMPAALAELHRRLKQAFDPDRILNPGRLYSWL